MHWWQIKATANHLNTWMFTAVTTYWHVIFRLSQASIVLPIIVFGCGVFMIVLLKMSLTLKTRKKRGKKRKSPDNTNVSPQSWKGLNLCYSLPWSLDQNTEMSLYFSCQYQPVHSRACDVGTRTVPYAHTYIRGTSLRRPFDLGPLKLAGFISPFSVSVCVDTKSLPPLFGGLPQGSLVLL